MLGMSLLMGARGVGALVGPLVAGRWAGDRHTRLRSGIVAGFLLAAAGYIVLGSSSSVAVAILMVIFAHAGSSTNWVFSTTLLQVRTTDRFRGRVFAAEYGLCMLAISASSYIAGAALDFGVPPHSFAVIMGLVMLIPAGVWAMTIGPSRQRR
jgi:predicted MFS family arabinose efflux permease